MKNTTFIDAEMKSFLTSLILENKELIVEKFRELDPYKMMSVVAKILPYITTKENNGKETKETEQEFNELNNTKNAKEAEIADEASTLPGLESETDGEECKDDEDGIEDESEQCVAPRTRRKKSKKKKKKKKRQR